MKSTIKLKNLLISIGSGHHPGIRLLHSMVKDKSESKILLFNLEKPLIINEKLKLDCSIKCSEYKKTFDLLKGWLVKNRFELIGISFMSHHWNIFLGITKVIRDVLPDCKIIAGGVHAWHISPLETLEYCDYVCAAEGEQLYSALIDRLSIAKDEHPLLIPGLIERKDGEIIHTPAKGYMPIDNLPMPTVASEQIYHLYALGDNPVFRNEDPQLNDPFGYIQTSRGCLFKCTYCINSLKDDKSRRVRPVDKIIEEIKILLTLKKIKAIFFDDEMFPLQIGWLQEFCSKYKKEINIPFVITLYPGMLNYEKAALLKHADLKEVSIGIQSGSERIRKDVYGRPGKNSEILNENKILSKLKIMTMYDFIIKNPFESEQDYKETLEIVHNLKHPFCFKIYTLSFYSKHPLTKMALDSGLIRPEDVDASTMGYINVTTPHIVAVVDRYPLENLLVVWHKKVRKDFLSGSIEMPYYLLMSYYGSWFMPRFICRFLRLQLIKKRLWILYIFSSLVQLILLIRNNSFIKKTYYRIAFYHEKGLVYTINKIWVKIGLRK